MAQYEVTTTGPRGETYQRRALRKSLEQAMKHQMQLPPSNESTAMRQGLQAAYDALNQAQRKYGEV